MKPYLRIALLGLTLVAMLAMAVTISRGAASRFHKLLQLGRGHIFGAEWHPSGKMMVVNTGLGAWFYDDKLQDIAHLDNARLATFSPAGKLMAASQDNKVML